MLRNVGCGCGGSRQIEEEEAPPLTYINRLARTVDNALLMKERRAAELRAQPYDADRMQVIVHMCA